MDRAPSGAIYLLRCKELSLSFAELDAITMGMVVDLLTEKANDGEEYPSLGRPGSLKSFLTGGAANG